jgi:hypothetical protein
MNQKVVKQIVVSIAALVLMVLFSACAGVGAPGTTTVTGSIVSVNPQSHSVTLNVNGQTQIINGLTDQEVTILQAQVGKTYTIQVTQNSDGSFTIQTGTSPQPGEGTPEPGTTPTGGPNEPGSIQFIGNVTSSSNGTIVVSMPDGSSLSMSTNGADLGDFNNTLPGVGTHVKVEVTASNGSFTATKIKKADSSDDATVVKYQGVTTSAVGSDRVIHFAVGNRSFSFPISSTAELKDFGGNAQSIANGTSVKVTVQFSGTSGTATDVGNNNG